MKYIKELEGLRGLMALWVVAGHAFASLPMLSSKIPANLLNTQAVDVFIMLSGFVIFFMMDNKPQSYGKYLTQRFFRIFPIYLLALIVSFVLIDFTTSVLTHALAAPATNGRLEIINQFNKAPSLHAFFHLLLIQGAVPVSMLKDSSFTILGQAWSVSVEWQFYIIAPLLFMLMNKITSKKNCLALFIILIFMIGYGKITDKGFYGNNLFAFSIGYLTFYFYKNIYPSINLAQLKIASAIAIFLSIILLGKDAFPVIIWVASFYAVLKKDMCGELSFLGKVLDWRPVLYIGRISYSIYMVHMVIVFCILSLLSGYNELPLYMYAVFPVSCIVVSIAISSLTYRYIEKPMMSFGKRISGKRVLPPEMNNPA
ncbi:TPA: acyltransferase family protein [Klebsiella pneumoniae]|uniref:acyltransferase family protein n=1 Tax=Klebsiella pneumoniae TaxID=573 RepID=UPI000B315CAB|nr:acyltransferase [Klebsiella pneumoniae]EKZ6826022.1 acyltransferase [Klebsiella pneumoniae]QIU98972.1 acyltransferase [Klebsiella pneumoniae]HBR2133826.1 acyltransferase [Klebsiella pneumoniae]HBR5493588.1 acyltransferase [Klebsiella pneumoniae]HCI4302294.1 acyltransferase [Klebsiella pneumoniae]